MHLWFYAALIVGGLFSNVKTTAPLFPQDTKPMISVSKMRFPTAKPPIALVEKMFDSLGIAFHHIDQCSWSGYDYRPVVRFRIAYSKDELYLQYIVEEEEVRALQTQSEEARPYDDSCVEFFWIPADDGIYYNIETNAIGTVLLAGGAERRNRHRFSDAQTAQIRRVSSLGTMPFDTRPAPASWKITLAIPLSLYNLGGPLPSLEGRSVKANFYKCGDKLPRPHYLSWNPIGTERPNFHTPDYFGTLYFE